MSTKKILIIGAGFLQTFVIKKAKSLGYYVLTVDGNSNAEGFMYADEYQNINIVDQENCLKYARKHNIDGVMTAATDYGVLTASYIAQELNLPGLKYSSAQLIKNKYQVRKRLFEKNVDDTEQSYEVDERTDFKKLTQKISYPVMVKPCDGSGSRGTTKVTKEDEIAFACKYAIQNSLSKKAEIESFIKGNEYGVESFVDNGQIYIMSIIKKWMTKEPFYAELGHAIPSGLPEKLENKIKECVEKAILALDINFGAVNMDVIVTEDNRVHIVDVGARMGGNLIGSHLVPIGTGIDYMANLIKLSVGDPIDVVLNHEPCNVATKLLALTPGKIEELPDINKVEKKFNVEIHHHLQVGDCIQEYHTNLDGCGYIIAKGDTQEEVVNKAEEAREYIDKNIKRMEKRI